MYLVIPGIICLLVIAAIVLWSRRGPLFQLEVRDGRVVSSKGTAPRHFIRDVERICALWSIEHGSIQGRTRGKGVEIKVGGGIAPQHRQAFQNAWNHPMD